MITRSNYMVTWLYQLDIADGTNVDIPPGNQVEFYDPITDNPGAIPNVALTRDLPYLSFNIHSSRQVQLLIQTGATIANLRTMVVFVNPAGAVSTVYNLAPPHGQNGRLVITGNYIRFNIANASGANSTIEFQARVWKE